jgi:lipoyl(octanoyl) transferase
MRAFTDARTPQTPDELWSVEHPPVYTMGLKGRDGSTNEIHGVPVVYSDRGGDMTYHGPGQIVLYALLDLGRLGLGIKTMVHALEQAVMDYLSDHRIDAHRRPGAPGVYVDDKKIAALGLRIRRSCSYHGLAFNVDMDLTPFTFIDPCGYKGMEVTQLTDFGVTSPLAAAGTALVEQFALLLGYNALVNHPSTDLAKPSAPQHE